ncbi:MAG: hypothetical protein LR015_00530 [Verrucomicrobia bacterium]|nr:hypothetical protein [Verrucomicrobiota bacterium]
MGSKPQLLVWTICDAVHVDPATGKHYIMGCFSNIRARQFPAVHARMVWFVTLCDVSIGQHQIKFSYGLDMQAMKPIMERPFESKSPVNKINLVNEIHNLKFAEPGEYIIMLEIDDEPLLITSLGVSN